MSKKNVFVILVSMVFFQGVYTLEASENDPMDVDHLETSTQFFVSPWTPQKGELAHPKPVRVVLGDISNKTGPLEVIDPRRKLTFDLDQEKENGEHDSSSEAPKKKRRTLAGKEVTFFDTEYTPKGLTEFGSVDVSNLKAKKLFSFCADQVTSVEFVAKVRAALHGKFVVAWNIGVDISIVARTLYDLMKTGYYLGAHDPDGTPISFDCKDSMKRQKRIHRGEATPESERIYFSRAYLEERHNKRATAARKRRISKQAKRKFEKYSKGNRLISEGEVNHIVSTFSPFDQEAARKSVNALNRALQRKQEGESMEIGFEALQSGQGTWEWFREYVAHELKLPSLERAVKRINAFLNGKHKAAQPSFSLDAAMEKWGVTLEIAFQEHSLDINAHAAKLGKSADQLRHTAFADSIVLSSIWYRQTTLRRQQQ